MPDLILSVSSTVSFVQMSHEVKEQQQEPCTDGTDTCPQPSAHELDLMLLSVNLGGSYYFNDWLGVRLTLPLRAVAIDATFIAADESIMDDFVSTHHRDETLVGLGDLSMSATTRHAGQFNASLSWVLATSLGTTLPTGNVVENPEVLGGVWGLKHQHIFFGRGMPAPIVGFSGSLRTNWGFFEGGLNATLPFLETSSKTYVSTQEPTEHDGHHHDWDKFELGEYLAPITVTADFGVGSKFGTEDWSFTATAQVQHEEQAKWQGHPQDNTGKTELLAGVRSSLSISESMMLDLNIRIPVYLYTPSVSATIEMPFLLGLGFYFTGDL